LRIVIIVRVLSFDSSIIMLLINIPLRRILHWKHLIIVEHVVLRDTRHESLMHIIFPFILVVPIFNIFLIEVILYVFDFPVSLPLGACVSVIVLIKN
jgi:hypothetical protein